MNDMERFGSTGLKVENKPVDELLDDFRKIAQESKTNALGANASYQFRNPSNEALIAGKIVSSEIIHRKTGNNRLEYEVYLEIPRKKQKYNKIQVIIDSSLILNHSEISVGKYLIVYGQVRSFTHNSGNDIFLYLQAEVVKSTEERFINWVHLTGLINQDEESQKEGKNSLLFQLYVKRNRFKTDIIPMLVTFGVERILYDIAKLRMRQQKIFQCCGEFETNRTGQKQDIRLDYIY